MPECARTSTMVPPAKSMPKLRPGFQTRKSDATTSSTEIGKVMSRAPMKGILVSSGIRLINRM